MGSPCNKLVAPLLVASPSYFVWNRTDDKTTIFGFLSLDKQGLDPTAEFFAVFFPSLDPPISGIGFNLGKVIGAIKRG